MKTVLRNLDLRKSHLCYFSQLLHLNHVLPNPPLQSSPPITKVSPRNSFPPPLNQIPAARERVRKSLIKNESGAARSLAKTGIPPSLASLFRGGTVFSALEFHGTRSRIAAERGRSRGRHEKSHRLRKITGSYRKPIEKQEERNGRRRDTGRVAFYALKRSFRRRSRIGGESRQSGEPSRFPLLFLQRRLGRRFCHATTEIIRLPTGGQARLFLGTGVAEPARDASAATGDKNLGRYFSRRCVASTG